MKSNLKFAAIFLALVAFTHTPGALAGEISASCISNDSSNWEIKVTGKRTSTATHFTAVSENWTAEMVCGTNDSCVGFYGGSFQAKGNLQIADGKIARLTVEDMEFICR